MQKPNFKFGDRVKVYDEIATVLSVHYNGCEVRFDKPNKYGFTDYFVSYKNLKKVEEKEMKYKVGQEVIDNTGAIFEKGVKAKIVHVYNDPKDPPSYMVGDGIVSWYANEDELSPIFSVPKYRKYDRVNWFEGFSVYPSIIMDVRTVDGSPLYHIVTENQNRESDVLEDKLDRLPDKFEVNIHRDNNKTIAQLIRNGAEVMREGVTKCHPDDTYDFKTGADIAYKRLMGFPNVVETLKKENEDLKEQIRSYDGIRSNNADMINRNAELEERVKLLQNRNKSLSMSCNQWAENFAQLKRNKDTAVHNLGEENANLREQLSKQKEINKEQVDENKKLKAEIGKLKPFKDEIIIGDTVEITDGLATFSNYKVWLDEYAPYLMNRYKLHKTPRRGDAGIVMAKAKHYRSGEMLYAVLINGQVYIMGERSIKLHNN